MKILVFCFVLQLSFGLSAGSYFKMETKGGEAAGITEIFIKQDMVKVDVQKKHGFIYNGKTQMMTVISDSGKDYCEMSQKDMQKMSKKLSTIMQQMQAQLANMPADQRKMMEQMLKGQMPAGLVNGKGAKEKKKKYTFKKVKSGVVIGDWPTTKYISYIDGVKNAEFYAANWKALALKEDPTVIAIELSKTLSQMFSSLQKSFKGVAQGQAAFENAQGWMKYGIPIKVVTFKKGKVAATTLMTEVKSSRLSKAIFLPPKNYKKKKSPMSGLSRL